MEDIQLKISLGVQVETSMMFFRIFLADVVEEEVDLNLFSKIYLVVEVEDLIVNVEMIFYMNLILLWKMYYMENKSNLISKNM